MTSIISLRARWLIPGDCPPLANGVVTIADGKITSVDTHADGPVQDLGDVVLLPGLVNSHTHLEFSNLEAPLGQPGMSLPEWIRLVIASRGSKNRNPEQAIAAGLGESLRFGVTTIGEIATESAKQHEEQLPQVTAFQEVIGFSAARCDSALVELTDRISNSSCRSGISPHAPYTVHPSLLDRLVELSSTEKIPVAMHLAESPEELELLNHGTGPFQQLLAERSMWDELAINKNTRPRDYLKVLARAPRSIVVHGNYLDAKEIEYLASQKKNMSVAYCPRTHTYFEHEPYPLSQMLESGVRVSLGTDSRASNPDLSLLAEMRHIAQHHQDISPAQIIRMGTLSGAEALGISPQTGSLTPGKWADFTAIHCDPNSTDPLEDLLHSQHQPTCTWLRGQAVPQAL